MNKLFHKVMVFLAVVLTNTWLFQWLKAYDDSRIAFILDSDLFQPESLGEQSLWWCSARRKAL